MKTSNKILAGFFGLVLLLFFLFLIFVRFNLSPNGMGDGGERIKGNGKITTKKHQISNYQDIRLDESFEVKLQTGSEFLEITTDENLISHIEPAIKNGTLSIHVNEKVFLEPSAKVKMTIGINQLKNLYCSGNTHVTSMDTIKSAQLDLGIAGSGLINLIIQSNNTSVAIGGSGLIQLKGTCQELTTTIAGSGTIDAKNLVAQTVDAKVSGSGSATVHAVEYLNAGIVGGGNLMYKGDPQVREQIGGSGRISRVN